MKYCQWQTYQGQHRCEVCGVVREHPRKRHCVVITPPVPPPPAPPDTSVEDRLRDDPALRGRVYAACGDPSDIGCSRAYREWQQQAAAWLAAASAPRAG